MQHVSKAEQKTGYKILQVNLSCYYLQNKATLKNEPHLKKKYCI